MPAPINIVNSKNSYFSFDNMLLQWRSRFTNVCLCSDITVKSNPQWNIGQSWVPKMAINSERKIIRASFDCMCHKVDQVILKIWESDESFSVVGTASCTKRVMMGSLFATLVLPLPTYIWNTFHTLHHFDNSQISGSPGLIFTIGIQFLNPSIPHQWDWGLSVSFQNIEPTCSSLLPMKEGRGPGWLKVVG